jgi:large subunit ribosomal protein L35
MPKLKTHTGAKKRFKLTKNGKLKRAHAYRRHNLNASDFGKSSKRKRHLRKEAMTDKTNIKAIKLLMPYA